MAPMQDDMQICEVFHIYKKKEKRVGSLESGCPHSKPILVTLYSVTLDALPTFPEHVSTSGIVIFLPLQL